MCIIHRETVSRLAEDLKTQLFWNDTTGIVIRITTELKNQIVWHHSTGIRYRLSSGFKKSNSLASFNGNSLSA